MTLYKLIVIVRANQLHVRQANDLYGYNEPPTSKNVLYFINSLFCSIYVEKLTLQRPCKTIEKIC